MSGDAGITGNNQDPANWGPPSLGFSSIAGLSDALPNFNRNADAAAAASKPIGATAATTSRSAATCRRSRVDIQSQQNPRGAFTFNGAFTGSDFADFLLGVPRTSSIAFGNADKNLRAYSSDAYITDDWRFSPTLTMQTGARWEYETPMTRATAGS